MTTQPATDRENWPLEHMSPEALLRLSSPFYFVSAVLFPGDLRFHLLDQVCQQFLTFLPGLGVHIAGVFFAVWPDGGVPSFPQMVVDLADTAGAWLAPLTLVGLKGAGGGFAGRSFHGVLGSVLSNSLINFSGSFLC